MTWIAGVDGFKSKWCVVLENLATSDFRSRVCPDFVALLSLPERPKVVCIDIPIGLPEFTVRGGRECERLARQRLGRRASSVFSAVGRGALRALSRVDADGLSRAGGGLGIGAQAWGLSRKLREADAAISPELQSAVHEVHPEVSFWAMNRNEAVASSKKTPAGERERTRLLETNGLPQSLVGQMPIGLRVGRDDSLDACAALWTARRIVAGQAQRLPETVDRDSRGLDQAIWF